MPKSRKRKNRKKLIQYIPKQEQIPVGTEMVENPETGALQHMTKVAVIKTTSNIRVQHRPQKH